jgi:amidase
MNDLWRLTATEAVGKLRKRELSPLEIVEAAAARIEIVEPTINALPIRFFDEARATAQSVLVMRAAITLAGSRACQ